MKPFLVNDFMSQIDVVAEPPRNSYHRDVCDLYRRRNDAYSLITQINQLIKTVQKHRGYTMGLLAGDQSYRKRFDDIQSALQRRLSVLEIYGLATADLITEKDKNNLEFCWQTISNNWQEDNVNESLELHSHFVSQLLQLMNGISVDLGLPLLENVNHDTVFDNVKGQMNAFPFSLVKVELLHFVTKFMPENIEHIGKLRALSTHMASVANNTDSDNRKLRFLVESAREQINILRSMAARIKEISGGSYTALDQLFHTEMQLGLLLSQIDNSILSIAHEASAEEGRDIFIKATEVIDAYWLVVNRGVELMRQWHEDEFDFWLALNT